MCPAAARLNDPIAHTSTLGMLAKMGGSLVIGALIGAALTAAVAAAAVATVATGGLGLGAVLAIGFVISAAMEGSGLNAFIDKQVDRLVDHFIPPSIEGKIATGSSDVRINSLAAARAASPGELDTIVCAKHGSGPPPMLAQGSDNVFFDGQPAARKGDQTTCGGTIAEGSDDVFVGGGTVTVRDIDDERPWWITALGVAIGVALALCGKGKMNLSSLKAALPCLMKNMAASVAGSVVGGMLRTTIGNPVNAITGGKVLREQADFSLPAALPLHWERFYSSHDLRAGGLFGPGWSVPCEVSLSVERDAAGTLAALVYCDDQGRAMRFPPVPPGESHFSTAEGYYLICTQLGQYLVESVDGLLRDFGVPAPAFSGVLPLQRLEDRNGNAHTLVYASDGRLAQLRDGCGGVLDLVYDKQHAQRLAAVKLRGSADGTDGTLVQYRYTAAGELAEVIDRAGRGRRLFAYDQGLMTTHTVPGGVRCHYAWQGSGAAARVVRHWTDDGEQYVFNYDLAARSTRVTDQLGRIYRWEWDVHSQPVLYVDPEGNSWRYRWDDNRQLVQTVDPLGAVTLCEYDERGRQIAVTNPLGQVRRTEWHDRFDLPLAETDEAGNRRAYSYDQRGNLILITDEEGCETEQFRDERGIVHTVRDARDGYKHMQWNSRAQLLAYTDCSGSTTRFDYDRRGRLTSATDALGQSTRYDFDEHDAIVRINRADGTVEQFAYDSAGQLCTSTDAAGRVTRYVRNARGLPVRRIDAAGHSVQFEYDAAHRLHRLINENGEAYCYRYDRNDRRIEEIGLDGVIRRIDYDARGLAIAVTDAVGESDAVVLRIEHDALGRERFRHARGRTTAYRYDQIGQVLQAEVFSDAGMQRIVHDNLSFTYSKRGQTLSEAGHMGKLEHRYDELGNRIATMLPDGRTINRLHYGSGHLHQFNIDGDVISDIERDALHREVLRTQGRLHTRIGYDALGHKTSARTGELASPLPLVVKEWRYDAAGELVQKTHSLHGDAAFLYDPLGRIVYAAEQQVREMFHWDAAANLVDSGAAGGYVRYNRVLTFEDKRFEYDVHGRLEQKRSGRHTTQTFGYDGEHRLIEVTTARAGVAQSVHFDYDALGRRIRKHDAFGTTHFLWDGLRLLQEQRGAAIATYLYEPDSYKPLARIDSQRDAAAGDEAGASVYYFQNDASGLPEELTAPSGDIAWVAEYKTWGNTVREQWSVAEVAGAVQPLPQNLRFQGQYLDRDTGLHYNTFRFYDPDIGRFISPDPIGLLGGDNVFMYAPNPKRWMDPWGLTYGAVDFSGSPDLFPTAGVQRNIVSIELQGSRTRDFTLAYKEAKFTPAEAAAAKKAGYTWHHVRDYDPATGKSGMQLVLRTTHEATYPHAGSAEQFAKTHGVAYDSPAAVEFVERAGRLRGRPTGRVTPGC